MFNKKRISTLCMRSATIVFLALLLPILISAALPCPEKLSEFVHRMPKAILHVHLEGTIAPNTIIEIANRNGVAVPFKNEEQFRNLCNFSTFDDFVALYRIIQSCLIKTDDFKQIAYEYGKEAARQNICYSEVMVSLDSDCSTSGLSPQEIVDALNEGRKRAQKEFGTLWTWVFANAHPESVSPATFVDILLQMHNKNNVAIAMAVLEPLFNQPLPADYQNAYNRAIAAKLPVIPHSGEFEGPSNIKNALSALGACPQMRIDHGVQCIQDENLELDLARRHIPLDVCITSNVCLHVFQDYAHHPVRNLFDAGLRITINTDDPAIFGIDLNAEYDHLIYDYHFTLEELQKISLNGILASILPPTIKEVFELKFKSECAQLCKEIFGV